MKILFLSCSTICNLTHHIVFNYLWYLMPQLWTPKIYMIHDTWCKYVILYVGRLGCWKMWGGEMGAHNIEVFCKVTSSDNTGEAPRDPYPVPTVLSGADGSPFATATPPSSRPFWLRSGLPFVFASGLPFLVGSHLPFWLGSSLPVWLGSRLPFLFESSLAFLFESSLPFLFGSSLPRWLWSSLPFWLGWHSNCTCSSVALPSLLPVAVVHLKPTCKETINQPKYPLLKYHISENWENSTIYKLSWE